MIHIEQRVDTRGALAMHLLVHAYNLTQHLPPGERRDLANELGRQSGYCLDAPDLMPAGGMHWWEIEYSLGLPEQLTIERP